MSDPIDPAAVPAIVPPAIATPVPSHVTNPPGWAPGAYDRFQGMGRDLAATKAALALAQAQAARIPGLEAAHAADLVKNSQEMAMAGRSHINPDLAHQSVRNHLRGGYTQYATDGGAEPFGAWLDLDATKADPVYGRHLQAAAPVAPAPPADVGTPPAAVQPPPPTPPVDAGITPDDQTQGTSTYSDSQIAAMSKDPAQWALHGKEIRAQLTKKFGRKLGSGS